MKKWLNGKTILITGASSGIGKEIATQLITKHNCVVLGVARREEKLKAFKESLNEKADKFLYITADVSKKDDWQNILTFAKNNVCSVLINNAGTMHPFCLCKNLGEEKVKQICDTNFFSCYYGFATFCEYFESLSNSAIINISSSSSIGAIPGESMYSASKSALTSFSRIISSEEKGKIYIGTFLPGFTKTDLFFNHDNAKPIFDQKSLKFINKFCTPVNKMASKIIKAIIKKKRLKVLGKDSKILKILNTLMPVKSSDLYLKIFKKTKFECFDDLNK